MQETLMQKFSTVLSVVVLYCGYLIRNMIYFLHVNINYVHVFFVNMHGALNFLHSGCKF